LTIVCSLKGEGAPSDSSLDLPPTVSSSLSSASFTISSTTPGVGYISSSSSSSLSSSFSSSYESSSSSLSSSSSHLVSLHNSNNGGTERGGGGGEEDVKKAIETTSTTIPIDEMTSSVSGVLSSSSDSVENNNATTNGQELSSYSSSSSSVVRWMTLIEQDVARSYLSGIPFGITSAVLRKRRQLAVEEEEEQEAANAAAVLAQETESERQLQSEIRGYNENGYPIYTSSSHTPIVPVLSMSAFFQHQQSQQRDSSSSSSSSSSSYFPTVSLSSFLSVPQTTHSYTQSQLHQQNTMSPLQSYPTSSSHSYVSPVIETASTTFVSTDTPLNIGDTDNAIKSTMITNETMINISDDILLEEMEKKALSNQSLLQIPIEGITEIGNTNIEEEEVLKEDNEEDEEEEDDSHYIETRRNELQLILLSCAASEPDIRYCQGMNFIARLLLELCHHTIEKENNKEKNAIKNEENNVPVDISLSSSSTTISSSSTISSSTTIEMSHISLAVVDASNLFRLLLNKNHLLRLHDLFLPSMRTLRLRLYQLDRLLLRRAPELHSHLTSEGVTINTYASPWLLTLFTSFSVLDANTTYAVWDAAIIEGFAPVMRMSLAVLIVLEKFLISSSMETCLSALQLPRPYITKILRDQVGIGNISSLLDIIRSTKGIHRELDEKNIIEIDKEKEEEEIEDEEEEEEEEEEIEKWAMNRLWIRALGNPILLTSHSNWKNTLTKQQQQQQQMQSQMQGVLNTTSTTSTSSSSSSSSSMTTEIELLLYRLHIDDLYASKQSFVSNEELLELEGDFDASQENERIERGNSS
jgi:hypothetical protein